MDQKDFPSVQALCACASFKGTLSSKEAGAALARGLKRAGLAARSIALADGGEGLVEALFSQVTGAVLAEALCRGPLQAPVTSAFAILPPRPEAAPHTAVLEMAASSGLELVAQAHRDPKAATTLGVGDQILAALDFLDGCQENLASPPLPPLGKGEKTAIRQSYSLLLGLGGSGTNDGGAGLAQALGAKLLDRHGRPLRPGGAALLELDRIDISGLDKRLARTTVLVACDVRNPLCGAQGASAIFGPQKGASAADIKLLDEALAHYAAVIQRDLGRSVAEIPGAGAAGGLGAGCLTFLNATLKPGIELVLDALDFDALLADAALVLTGEGRLDEQTLMGKAPAGVAERARQCGIPCVAVGGSIDHRAKNALNAVFRRIESLTDFAGSQEAARGEPGRWLEELARAKGREWLAE